MARYLYSELEYKSLTDALRIIKDAKLAVYRESGTSPAWDMLRHATNRLHDAADAVLRAESGDGQ